MNQHNFISKQQSESVEKNCNVLAKGIAQWTPTVLVHYELEFLRVNVSSQISLK